MTDFIQQDASPVSGSATIATRADILAELGLTGVATSEQETIIDTALRKAAGAVKSYLRYEPVQGSHTEYYPQQAYQSQPGPGVWEVTDEKAVLRQVSESATNELQLRHLPIRSVASVNVDYDGRSGTKSGSFGSGTSKTEGEDYWANYDEVDGEGNKICKDGILRAVGLWPTTPGTVKVVYTAGYSDDELRGNDSIVDASPIWLAIVEEATRLARRTLLTKKGSLGIPAGVLTSENLGDYSYSVEAGSLQRLFSGELMPETKARLADFVNWGYALG